MDKRDIFLLTKPPHNKKTELCLSLLRQSKDAILYLAGDGVYNIFEVSSFKFLPSERLIACQEDLEARGISSGDEARVSDDFYRQLVEDMSADNSNIYVF
jgi:tRNA 2-thiouridine synthesizing protein B